MAVSTLILQVAHKRTIVEVLLDFIKIMKSFSYGRDGVCVCVEELLICMVLKAYYIL